MTSTSNFTEYVLHELYVVTEPLALSYCPLSMQQADSDQAVNPFTSRGSTPSFAHCIWEALKGRSDGLSVQDIADVMQEQNLRDMSNLKNPSGQVVQQAAEPLQSHMHTNIWNICQELCMCSQFHVSAGLRGVWDCRFQM